MSRFVWWLCERKRERRGKRERVSVDITICVCWLCEREGRRERECSVCAGCV